MNDGSTPAARQTRWRAALTSAARRLPGRASDWLRRQERETLAIAALATLGAAVLAFWYLAPVVRSVGWTASIDDSYIHYRYAWMLGRGHFFRFHPGDPFSTGATSPLYVLLLALPAAMRVSRGTLIAVSQLFGVLTLAVTLAAAALAARNVTARRGAAVVAMAMTLSSGLLAWLYFSGMETGLYLALLALLLERISRWDGAEPPRGLVLWAALLPIARPDGIVAAGLCAVLMAVRARNTDLRRGLVRAALVLSPFALYMLVTLLYTGRFVTAGLEMKAVAHVPYLSRDERLDHVITNATKAVLDLLGGRRPEHAIVGALPLAVVGWLVAVGLDIDRRRVGLGTIGLAITAAALLSGAQVEVRQWRMERYFAPFLFLGLFGAALALGFAARALRKVPLEIALGALLLLASAPQWKPWRKSFVEDAKNIVPHRVHAAEHIRDRLPPDARIYVCDAGVLGYYADRWTYDAVGLTTPMRGNSYINGGGSRFEELERWPREKWPNYACILPWCGIDTNQLKHIARFGGLELTEFRVPALGTGTTPLAPHAGALVDTLDVADVASEMDHGWRDPEGSTPGVNRNFVGRGSYPGQAGEVADGGRSLAGAIAFRLRGSKGARGGRLVARVKGGPVALRVQVQINGGTAIDFPLVPADASGAWHEPELPLPPDAGDTFDVVLRIPPPARLPLFHLWLFQEAPSGPR